MVDRLLQGINALLCSFMLAGPLVAQQDVVTSPPQAGAILTLTAVYDQQERHNAFSYAGKTEPPLIRVSPGESIQVRYLNDLPVHSDEKCALAPCENMGNLHFHGLNVSPRVEHILIAPAGRVEAIVSGPGAGTRTSLSTRCVDTGPDGDNNPAMVLADVVSSPQAAEPERKVPALSGPAVYKNGFYINGKKFAMHSAPTLRARVGSVQPRRVVNATGEVHRFHIHQVHFLAYAVNGVPSEMPEWLDTVNLPYGGTVDLIMDFTDPVIRGYLSFTAIY
jgi:FtsP/CotA-like multicopper oxidase with cupredoxin domain